MAVGAGSAWALPISQQLSGMTTLDLRGESPERPPFGFYFNYGTPYVFYDGRLNDTPTDFPRARCLGLHSVEGPRMTIRLVECDEARAVGFSFQIDFGDATLEDIDGFSPRDFTDYSSYEDAFRESPLKAEPGMSVGPGRSRMNLPSGVPVAVSVASKTYPAKFRRLSWDVFLQPMLQDDFGLLALQYDRGRGYKHPSVVGKRPIIEGTADLLKCGEGSLRMLPCKGTYFINNHEEFLPAINACAREIAGDTHPELPISLTHWGIYNPDSSHSRANAVDIISIRVGQKTFGYEKAFLANQKAMTDFFVSQSTPGQTPSLEQVWSWVPEFRAAYTGGKLPKLEFLEFWEPLFNCLAVRGISVVAGPPYGSGTAYRFWLIPDLRWMDPADPRKFVNTDVTVNHIDHVHTAFDFYDCTDRGMVLSKTCGNK